MSPFRLSAHADVEGFSEAELSAAVIDGELIRLGDLLIPADAAGLPSDRAAAAMGGLSGKLIAEQWTAAWIWGATETPPALLQFCSLPTGRARLPSGGVRVREVLARPDELAVVGGRLVTTPGRTLSDLARWSDTFPSSTMRRLRELGGVDVDALLDGLASHQRLPGKRRAVTRLRALLTELRQPELTRYTS